MLRNNDAKKAANLNDPYFSILFWIIDAPRQLMTSVFILNRITGKNYDFLKLSYFSYFWEVEICINLVPSLSHPNHNIPQSHTPF